MSFLYILCIKGTSVSLGGSWGFFSPPCCTTRPPEFTLFFVLKKPGSFLEKDAASLGVPGRGVLATPAERESGRPGERPQEGLAETHAPRPRDGEAVPAAVRAHLPGTRPEPVQAHRRRVRGGLGQRGRGEGYVAEKNAPPVEQRKCRQPGLRT